MNHKPTTYEEIEAARFVVEASLGSLRIVVEALENVRDRLKELEETHFIA